MKSMTSSKKQLPENFAIVCPLSFEAADKNSSPENSIPSFSMVAYTGGVMNIAGFPHPVVVDLQGLSIDRQDIPVRLDHNPRQGVGHTTGIVIVDNTVLVEGMVSRDTAWARDVAQSGVKGFPWQASIGAAVVEADFIPHGSEVVVNKQKFTGPLHVVRKSVLKEVSFVDSGADTNTQAKIAAKAQENEKMEDVKTSTDTAADGRENRKGSQVDGVSRIEKGTTV